MRLIFAALLLASLDGKAGDLNGRKRVLQLAIVVFLAGSLALRESRKA